MAHFQLEWNRIIQAYSNLIRNSKEGKYDNDNWGESWNEDVRAFQRQFKCPEDDVHGFYGLSESCRRTILQSDQYPSGYAVYDINRDGILELLVLSEIIEPHNYVITDPDNWDIKERIYEYVYNIDAIFTLNKGKPIMLGAYYHRCGCSLIPDGTLYVFPSWGCSPYENRAYILPPGSTELRLIEKRISFGGANGDEFYIEKEGVRTNFGSGDEFFAMEPYPRGWPDDPIFQLDLTFVPIAP